MTFKVTEVYIQLVPRVQGLFALARVVLSGAVVIDGIGVHHKQDGQGYRLTYPTRRLTNGQSLTIVHPITPELSQAIEHAIFQKIVETQKAVEPHDRYGASNF